MREWKEGRREERREEGKIGRKGHSCWKAEAQQATRDMFVDKQCFVDGE